jgi:twitching motility two-component system response regulator PilG
MASLPGGMQCKDANVDDATREEIMSQEQLNTTADKPEISAESKKLRILVVDDSATIRRSAETMLASEGCEVFTAENGFEALSKITRHKPDLIFVDIMMPRLDGYQTCAIIKNNAEFRDTPVVMLTSKDGLFDMARGRVVGSDQYLTKPFTREELLGAVKQHATT